ncbi:MAG: glycogen debranching protein [Candidatus Altarchaeum sp. CG12_big_fil_rev_8_21_14_0_65_33_22]|nr:MAG: glycogen debranching protein [Candidatus Altarchaeum sp. CG12_big_fil_rev_8_21_14_0_65_33_22]PJC14678.1 MAG: glycogen debranching protein [Candidatus Altarchaeum sp. CG_4_9_14_0_8_um_filter_32_206]
MENTVQKMYFPEYLITNGLDGYASSTILNLNTRKYHGLFVVADYDKNNYVILSGIDERIEINGKIYELGNHHYKEDYDPNKRDIFFPRGFKFLKNFKYSHRIFPKFYYEVEDVGIEKEILMPHGFNTVIVHYKIKNKDDNEKDIKFSINPLLNMRDYHKNLHISVVKDFTCEVSAAQKGIIVSHGKIKVRISSDTEFLKNEYILRNVFYQKEWERGYDPFEDLYCPGSFFGDKGETTMVASFNETKSISYEKYKQEEILRIENLKNLTSKRSRIFQELSTLADKFIIKHSNSYGIIAGYHWFDEWGRDTMISIPGLCLATGRFDVAKGLIKGWLNFMQNGLILNFIPVRYPFECPYNSSDASLWFLNAVYHYYTDTKDIKFIEEIHQKLCEIAESYIRGNSACKMDNDCLIVSNAQTTWMDTKWTKREGKAVEINALWYNALNILKFFSYLLNKNFDYEEILENVKKNFEIFWNEKKGCLYDVILNNKPDDSIRPNQIFAIGLPFNVIDNDNDERARKIFNVVFGELYTPYGLRTLSKKSENYRGIYEGNEENRDKAYHNGTVWPFLIGVFIEAYLKINNYSRESKDNALKFLNPLLEYAEKFNMIPEIFDGDYHLTSSGDYQTEFENPHKPGGCIAQAWSVAEVLRIYALYASL